MVVLVFHIPNNYPFYYGKFATAEAAQSQAQGLSDLARLKTGHATSALEWVTLAPTDALFDEIHGDRPTKIWRAPFDGGWHMILGYGDLLRSAVGN